MTRGDLIQLTLTLKMITAQVVETSVTVNNNSPIQDYVHPDDHTQLTYQITPGFQPLTKKPLFNWSMQSMRLKRNKIHTSSINLRSLLWDQNKDLGTKETVLGCK